MRSAPPALRSVGRGFACSRAIRARSSVSAPPTTMAAKTYRFGKWAIDSSEVFLESKLSMAFVNYKPVVEGHVLVAPLRVVPRFSELSVEEVHDLWTVAQRVGTKIEHSFKADSLLFAIQDGKDAGQTVQHVHVHLMPRRPNDFAKNDDVYEELDQHDHASRRVDADGERQPRSAAEMAKEASTLRALFE